MIPATDEYKAYEALRFGATPAIRITLSPYEWPAGITAEGTFTHCTFSAPDKVLADYEGFAGGLWLSEILSSGSFVDGQAVITWTWNSPGYDMILSYRGATTLSGLAAASWTALSQGDTMPITPYYQFRLTIEGYRAWTAESEEEADAFTAWAS